MGIKMKILVTGSNGFIGGYITEYLLGKGYDIIGLGTKNESSTPILKYIKIDISDRKKLLELAKEELKDIDVVVHAAASLSKNDFDERLIQSNMIGLYNMIELATLTACKKFIYISSCPVIGIPKDIPINEKHDLLPNTMYHITKLSGEYMVNLLEKYNIKPVSLRIPSPIGKNMPANTILSVFIKKAMEDEDLIIYGKGSRKQNYVDVRDIVQAVYLCIQKDKAGRCYNIASKAAISNGELAKYCIDVINSKSSIKFNGLEDPLEGQDWTIDITKAKEELGYEPRYTISDSIEWIVSVE